MKRYIFKITILLFIFYVSCDDANDLLNQYIKDGPIIYAAKVNELNTQAGYSRLRVNIYPAEDVNRSYCVLSWNITQGAKDSLKVDYIENNFDNDSSCYYTFIDFVPDSGIEGNLEITAQNVDVFGNRSLTVTEGAYIYGSSYLSSLVNAQVQFSSNNNEITFEQKVSAVGNLLSYEQNSGEFTEEIFVTDERYPLSNAKAGGIVRTKTRYLISETDIDTLEVVNYLETIIPQI
ncbi:hypothetical protein INQ51_10800 [Maribellus sp. CM-23]|uniref:DUF4998 domain-containing protein n=1 Tax=Maribellus sp. CM-23 TaxID=2781026 RepID=UPI001F2C4BF4|nr:DUF4998 domain-containing protein [Maribellus sp. CM-23]MCE4564799.1 hypothetical protein [Maribellus sp. CM-23]